MCSTCPTLARRGKLPGRASSCLRDLPALPNVHQKFHKRLAKLVTQYRASNADKHERVFVVGLVLPRPHNDKQHPNYSGQKCVEKRMVEAHGRQGAQKWFVPILHKAVRVALSPTLVCVPGLGMHASGWCLRRVEPLLSDNDPLLPRIGCIAGNGMALGHAAQPGNLALGQLAGGGNAALTHIGPQRGR